MSVIPHFLRHLRNSGVLESPFVRRNLFPDDVFSILARDPFYRHVMKPEDRGVSLDEKQMRVHLDVGEFKPEEISVKASDGEVTISGQKKTTTDGGWSESRFERRFLLPRGFLMDKLQCAWTDGVLTVTAPRSEPLVERVIPVEHKKVEQKVRPEENDTKSKL